MHRRDWIVISSLAAALLILTGLISLKTGGTVKIPEENKRGVSRGSVLHEERLGGTYKAGEAADIPAIPEDTGADGPKAETDAGEVEAVEKSPPEQVNAAGHGATEKPTASQPGKSAPPEPAQRSPGPAANPEKQAGSREGTENGRHESDAVKTLRAFYRCLASEQYEKAYDMLDEKFRIRDLRLPGAEEYGKKDIDVNSFFMFGSLLKSVRIEKIVAEKNESGLAEIYFYQVFALRDGEEVRQPLAVSLKRAGKLWKIVAVQEGNADEKVFKN